MRSRAVAFSVAGASIALVLGIAFFASRGGHLRVYELRSGRSVGSPSLWMDVREGLGLQKFYSQVGQDKWILGVVFPGVDDGYFRLSILSSQPSKPPGSLSWM